jgi:glucokinase
MRYAIGLDIGGTNIKYGIVGEKGQVLYEDLRSTTAMPVPDNLKAVITELLIVASSQGLSISGIGVGVPAIIDQGIVTACGGNLPELEGMELGTMLQAYVQVPVVMDNDAQLMGLAELRFGAAKGLTDVVFLTIGTGIGGALVLNGALYSGHGNRGGELGHIRVASPGQPCDCGASGCLEAQASVKALIREYVSAGGEIAADGKLIFSHYAAGDQIAVTVMNRHFTYLGSGVASLINIFSPQKVVIGGGITEAGEDYIRPIRQHALALAMKETAAHTLIEGAMLGNKAGFLGAAAKVFGAG